MARIVKITAVMGLLALCGSAWAADSNGLVAHWEFDEGSGTIAYDSAGSNHGTLVNGPTWTTGQIDGALGFDGVDDYVDCGNDENLNVTELTWSLWIKRTETTYSNERALISNTGPKTGPQESRGTYALQIDEGGQYQDKIQFLRCGMPVEQCPLSKTAINDMNWHHIAVTRYINGDVTIYIDGYEDATGYVPERTAYGKTFIGTGHRSYSNFKGSIDEVAIYNRALSAEEVEELYEEGFSNYERMIMKLEDAAGKKQAALETIEEALDEEWDAYGTLEEMLESKDYGDLKKGDIVRAKQEIHSAMQHQEQSAGALDKSIEGLYDALTALGWEPDANLISHWKFDEGSGSTAYDSAGDNDGTLVNGPTWTSGQIDGALTFDSLDDYVDCGNDSSLAPSKPVSVVAWVEADSVSGECAFVSSSGATGGFGSSGYHLGYKAGTYKFWVTTGSNGNYTALSSGIAPQIGAWEHIAGVYDGTEMRIYINGILKNSTGKSGNIYYKTKSLYIGSMVYETGIELFDGVIDDVRIYDRALTSGEIWQLYQDGL